MANKDLIASFIYEQIVEERPIFRKYSGTKAEKMPKELLRMEAEKRGLFVREDSSVKHRYEILDEGGHFIGDFRALYTSANAVVATVISANKDLTKSFLNANGVPTPRGISFASSQFAVAKAYMSSQGTPMVLKPVKGNAGKGVAVNLRSVKQLEEAFRMVKGDDPKQRYILEEYVEGIDLRIYVVHGRVVAAASRIPAHVIGNGRDDIHSLIIEANKIRGEHPHHRAFPLQADWEMLSRMGIDGSYRPKDSEVVVLNYVFNIHKGGYCLDVTDSICDSIKEVAISAASAVPGTEVVGVDMYVTSLQDATNSVVLELNHHGNFMIHHFPAYGHERNVASAILDEIVRQFEEKQRQQKAVGYSPM